MIMKLFINYIINVPKILKKSYSFKKIVLLQINKIIKILQKLLYQINKRNDQNQIFMVTQKCKFKKFIKNHNRIGKI